MPGSPPGHRCRGRLVRQTAGQKRGRTVHSGHHRFEAAPLEFVRRNLSYWRGGAAAAGVTRSGSCCTTAAAAASTTGRTDGTAALAFVAGKQSQGVRIATTSASSAAATVSRTDTAAGHANSADTAAYAAATGRGVRHEPRVHYIPGGFSERPNQTVRKQSTRPNQIRL